MNNQITRRNFLAQSGSLVGGAVLTAAGAQSALGKAAIGEVKPALYSITYLGYWYHGAALSMAELLQRAKTFGFEGLEIEGKGPHGRPYDWPKNRCVEFRQKAADSGIAITGVAADNDFSSPISEHRESQLEDVCGLIRMTSDLGAKVLRVFLAWPGATKRLEGGGRYDIAQNIWKFTHEKFSEEESWAWCRAGLVNSAKCAGDHGVTLALQNHRPMVKTYQDVLRMVHEVGSPHLKVCLDAPLMEKKDPEYLRKAVYDAGPLQVHSHYGGEYEQKEPGGPILQPAITGEFGGEYIRHGYSSEEIYLPFIKAMLETGYRGYIGYELCHPLPVVDGKLVGIDFVDKNTRLGLEYIRGVIAQAKKEVTAQLRGSAGSVQS